MRLTLRTLLAYLDDILEPAQTKEIGSKLTESKFASDLVERIRDVMRRRRLSAPEVEEVDGSLDANVMAAYLDNTLAPDKVTDVEKICLESDVHLAEAAACHQILTMVLGEPVEIASDSRRRMYGLVSQGSGDNHAAIAAGQPAEAAAANDELDDLATPTRPEERTEKIDSLVPDYLRKPPFWQRALYVTVPAVLVGLLAILIFTDQTFNSRFGKFFGGSDNTAGQVAANLPNHPSVQPVAKHKDAASGAHESLPGATDAVAAGGAAKLPVSSTSAAATPPSQTEPKSPATETAANGPDSTAGSTLPNSTLPGSPLPDSTLPGAAGPTSPAPSLPDTVTTTNPTTATPTTSPSPTAPTTAAPGGTNVAASPTNPATTGGPATLTPATPTPAAPTPAPTTPTEMSAKPGPSTPVASIGSAKSGRAVPAPPVPGITGSESKSAPAPASGAGATAKPEKSLPETPLEVKLVSKSGVLLGYDPTREDWFVLERPSLKLPSPADETPKGEKGDPATQLVSPAPPVPMAGERRADLLAAPEPFDNQLDLGDGLCRLWLVGGSSARLLAPAGESRFGIELREGRIVLRSGLGPNSTDNYTPLVVTLVVRGDQYQVKFLHPDTQCGIEITPQFPNKPGQDAKDVSYNGGLYIVSGDVQFTAATGRQWTLAAGRSISLAPSDLAVATDLSGASFRLRGAAPTWLNPETRKIPPSLTRIAKDFGEAFLADQPVSLSIGTLAKSEKNPKIAEFAAKTLALTRQYPSLVEVLAQVPHEEAVQAAARGLRAWLPLSPTNVAQLQKELSTAFVPAVEDIVLRLLWGYNIDDARNLETSKQLVEWLDNDKLAVRVLAIDQISALTGGQTLRYRAGMKTGDRKATKKQWDHYVEQHKGLVHK